MIEPTKTHHLIACFLAYFDTPPEDRDTNDLRNIGQDLYIEGGTTLMRRAYMLAVVLNFNKLTLVRDTERIWKGIGDFSSADTS